MAAQEESVNIFSNLNLFSQQFYSFLDNNIDNEPSLRTNYTEANNSSIREDSSNCSSVPNTKARLKIVHWNCNGAASKMGTIKFMADQERPDVICLNEIKCLKQSVNGELIMEGYDLHFKCRTAKGGGVAVFVRETLDNQRIELPDSIKEEIVGVKLHCKELVAHLFAFYNPPNKYINSSTIDYIESNITIY